MCNLINTHTHTHTPGWVGNNTFEGWILVGNNTFEGLKKHRKFVRFFCGDHTINSVII